MPQYVREDICDNVTVCLVIKKDYIFFSIYLKCRLCFYLQKVNYSAYHGCLNSWASCVIGRNALDKSYIYGLDAFL